MRKAQTSKVRLNRSDVYRAVLTDTNPFEVPIIFSNDGFYKNLIDYKLKSPELQNLIDVLVCNSRKFTIPLRYNIVKDSDNIRTLSLIQPYSQVEIAKFYAKFDHLICMYTTRSPYSIRHPNKVGTTFFIKSRDQNINKYKNASIDTMDIEEVVRNPTSYFSYDKFDRLYRFFLSDDHTQLEKKYKFRLLLDVSKCFDSIYTHTITWAVKNKRIAKQFRFSSTFGNDFDRLMQQLNHNETSGICIGPETSRIFAEIILSKVDQVVFEELTEKKLFNRSHYECKRYVDNYYIFANEEEVLSKVQHEISIALREYKLHLNLSKSEKLTRPFYTQKSLVIDRANQSISQLWDKTLENRNYDNHLFHIPKPISHYQALFGNFTRQVKAACFSSKLGYDAIANYIVAAMKRKLVELCDDFKEVTNIKDEEMGVDIECYRELLVFILDVGFYFFTLHPTVASSFRLSHAMVVCAQYMTKYDKEGLGILREYILRWTNLLVKSPTLTPLLEKSSVVPIELLNILVAIQEFSTDGSVEAELLDKAGLSDSDDQYFQIIVQLFICKDHPKLRDKKDAVFRTACNKLTSQKHFITKETELAYLLLDLLSCPFISARNRGDLLRDVWPVIRSGDSSIEVINKKDAENLVEEIEEQHWFVWWQGINLRNIIEKKELSAVYA